MCIGKPECQRCETCGQRKYQLWADKEMHDRGCPWGFGFMHLCPDAVNRAKLTRWALDNDVRVTDAGKALVTQMEGAGVDLYAPAVDLEDFLP